ncbi:MAG: histidinol-phosphatase [Alphaproteobacteria bacterium]|nr:histidinol-phosphatase [Alphaproteobacteria bacterium]
MTAVDFSAFVDELATLSGAAILPFFRSSLAASDKNEGGLFDPVTEADRASEVVMRKRIREVFPHHGIVGEEFGSENADAEFVWVLDPIDGTKAFISGLPLWGTLIGLSRNGSAAYGMMNQPFTKERFFGDGGKATLKSPQGERTLKTRSCASLKDATLSSTSMTMFNAKEAEAFRRVEAAARLTRFGYDCYAYCMVAAGFMDLVIEANLKPYDVVALIPIIEGAGGIMTTWDGKPATEGGQIIAAGDKLIHAEALALLNR